MLHLFPAEAGVRALKMIGLSPLEVPLCLTELCEHALDRELLRVESGCADRAKCKV